MLKAKFTKPTAGYDYDREKCARLLKLNEYYDVEYVSMGQFHTSINLNDFPNEPFNSVNFEFYEDGKPINIFRSPKYNPYMTRICD